MAILVGSNKQVQFGDWTLPPGSQEITLSLFIYPTLANQTSIIFSKAITTDDNDVDWIVGTYSRNRIYTKMWIGGDAEQLVSPDNIYVVEQRAHVALTYDGTFLTMYINGVLITQRSRTGFIKTTNSPVMFGGLLSGSFPYTGSAQDLRVYSRGLSEKEVQHISSSNGRDGLLSDLFFHGRLDGPAGQDVPLDVGAVVDHGPNRYDGTVVDQAPSYLQSRMSWRNATQS